MKLEARQRLRAGSLEDRLKKAYKFGTDDKGRETIEIKDGKDFPFRIVKRDGDQVDLQQGWHDRKDEPYKWYSKKKGTRDQVLEYLIKRHNKDATPERGLGWKPV